MVRASQQFHLMNMPSVFITSSKGMFLQDDGINDIFLRCSLNQK